MTTLKEAAAAMGEKVSAVKGAADEVRRSASEILGKAGASSEGALHSAASTVRNAGAGSAAVLDGLAETTGRRLAAASSYLESDCTGRMFQDLGRVVQRHPGACLLLAAVIAGTMGFVAGSSRDSSRGG